MDTTFTSVELRPTDIAAAAMSSSKSWAVPASRQKSCNACVRGKRRCDKTRPICTRCAAKGLDCVYQKSSSAAAASSTPSTAGVRKATKGPPSTTTSSSSPKSNDFSSLPTSASSMSMDFEHDFDMAAAVADIDIPALSCPSASATATATTTTSPDSLALDPNLELSMADWMSSAFSSGDSSGHHGLDTNTTASEDMHSSIWNLPDFSDTLNPKMSFPSSIPLSPSFSPLTLSHFDTNTNFLAPREEEQNQQLQPLRDTFFLERRMEASECLNSDPLSVHDPRSRIGYVLSAMTSMPASFSRDRSLPFIHPQLYRSSLPPTLMMAWCAATAYTHRTPATRGWAVQRVMSAAAEIRDIGKQASSPLEKLARLQALAVVEMMRMFDGDIGMRSAAEKEEAVVDEWLTEVVKLCADLDEGVPLTDKVSKDTPPKSWDHWTLVESARRTVLITISFLCLIRLLKSEIPDIKYWNQFAGFTASRHLWEATTSAGFFRSWREKPQWVIENMSFLEFWKYARPEDVDDFTRLILTTQVGPDQMEHFMQGDDVLPDIATGVPCPL